MKNKKYTKRVFIMHTFKAYFFKIFRITANGDRRITASGDPRITAESI